MAIAAPGPVPREIPVTITIDPSGAIKVSPQTFRVSKSNNEEVVWRCTDPSAYFTVDFGKDGSPFYESQFSSHSPCSGLIRRDVLPDPGKNYKYTVRVDSLKLDPDGIVVQ